MNKTLTKFGGLFLGLAMIVGTGAAITFGTIQKKTVETLALDTTASVDFSTLGFSNSQKITATVNIDSNVKVEFDNSNASIPATYYDTGSAIRVYAGGVMRVTASSGLISSITLTFGSGEKDNEITTDVGTFESPTWTGSSESVAFTVQGDSGHRRIKTLSVTYSGNTVKTLESLTITGNMEKTTYRTDEEWDPTGFVVNANYDDKTSIEVTSEVDWSYSPAAPAKGVTSVTATATYQGKFEVSEPQPVTVTEYVAELYAKVTSAPTDWTGEYILVYESDDSAFVWTGVDTSNCYASETIIDNKISKPFSAVTLEIASMTEGYSIKVVGGENNGKYISGKSGSNTIVYSNSETLNTLAIEENSAVITSNGSKLLYNKTSGQDRFRYYKEGSKQQPVQLYKKSTSEPSANVIAYAQSFLQAGLCGDGTGVAAPSTTTWNNLKTGFDSLSDSDKTTFKNATYTVTGSGNNTVVTATNGTLQNVAEVVAKYDFVIQKYGTSDYVDFMDRALVSSRLIKGSAFENSLNNRNTSLIVIVSAIIGLSTIGAISILRKRRKAK